LPEKALPNYFTNHLADPFARRAKAQAQNAHQRVEEEKRQEE
jgi:hypothetical protein